VTTVALTGATGFIGRVLLKHLSSQGIRIQALYRPSSSPPPQSTNSIDWQAGTLEEKDRLRALVSGADSIIHCAGAVRGRTLEQFKAINTEGVERLVQVASEHGVKHFILMSSLAAREPDLSPYAASKKLGEEVLSRYADRISWSIVRPPAVYGPGDREMQPLLKLIKHGLVPVIGDKNGRFSLIHVDDLAKATICLLQAGSVQHGQCFELHDGHAGGYTWQQIAEIATSLNGKQPRCLSIPRFLMRTVGLANFFWSGLIGYQPMLTPGKVREIFHPDWVCDNTSITDAIGWQPEILFKEGLRRLLY
jgi:nucleoside-diphosphate-sugar epimerase